MTEPVLTRGAQRRRPYKKRVDCVVIPTLREQIDKLMGLPGAIELIEDKEKLTESALARSLGVPRTSLWRWRKGLSEPRETLITLCIISWAERLRQGNGQMEDE